MTTLALLPDPREPLDHETAEQAFADILDGKADDQAIGEFLTAMTIREETSVEIAAAALALRARMIEGRAPKRGMDVCGTGGAGAPSRNI